MEVPAMVVLDSLNLHDAAVIIRNVRIWLDHEWDKKYTLTGSRILMSNPCSYLNLMVRVGNFVFIHFF
jgi:hypothetical protein